MVPSDIWKAIQVEKNTEREKEIRNENRYKEKRHKIWDKNNDHKFYAIDFFHCWNADVKENQMYTRWIRTSTIFVWISTLFKRKKKHVKIRAMADESTQENHQSQR